MSGRFNASKHARIKGKGKNRSFVMFPHYMLNDPKFLALSGRACKALLYLAGQYKGSNNGDLQAAASLLASAGWKSRANVVAGLRELEEAGFIVKSRQGGRNRCNLFALTWFPVDECDGKHDLPATSVPPNDWRRIKNGSPPVVQLRPPAVQSETSATPKSQDWTASGPVATENAA